MRDPRTLSLPKHPLRLSPTRTTDWFFYFLIAAAVLFAFYPALTNGFIAWDDPDNFINNTHFRGFHADNLYWMFTSFHMGVYIPLTWISFAFDYILWGLNPLGYHLTNIILHALNAIGLFAITRHLLTESSQNKSSPAPDGAVALAATAGALFFALHPLRVESVAWATERRDVLSGFFFLLTILFYLRPGGRNISVFAYALSLLSKATGVTLPALLILIDAYRHVQNSKNHSWIKLPWKKMIADKLPYFLLAIPFAVIALVGQKQDATMAPWAFFDLRMRIAVAAHSVLFYIGKMLWPFHLSPLYPLPPFETLYHWPYTGYLALVALITFLAVKTCRQAPAFLAAWAWYGIALFPVSGFFQSGGQLAADRYTYLPLLSGAVVVGGGVLYAWRRGIPLRALASVMGVLLLGMSFLTRQQCQLWHDSASFWMAIVKDSPDSVSGRNNLGAALAEQGHLREAVDQFQIALKLDPTHPGARRNLAKAEALLRSHKTSRTAKIQS